ncbi:GH12927 [Drosophila grimshawi]|uniref:GH12927 n=2 Tax=Drosophila grimshawi TaxID=7222 RepID=B4JJ12_DROGR|nr:GH12927 [Drosophila grimshawi]
MHTPKITVTNTTTSITTTPTTKTEPVPKSPDDVTALMPRKSLTSMTDDEIIQENLKEILDMKSREERKANGRLVAVIVAFLVIFMALYHALKRKPAALSGFLVPAGIMLFYGAWVVVLAKRDKHKRAMFERHIEEVALKNKSELEEKHTRIKHSQKGSASSSLQYVNELASGTEHRKKQRRHRQRQREHELKPDGLGLTADVKVHRLGTKRPSFRQKLFGQTIGHVKLLEMQCDSVDTDTDTNAPKPSTVVELSEKRKRMQRFETLPTPQLKHMSSAP